MRECVISLSRIEKEIRDHFVFYATNELIIYKDRQNIIAANCDGTEICRSKCPNEYKHYESIEFEDAVILIFSGKHMVFIDKYGSHPFDFDMPVQKFGRSLSRIIKAPSGNSIIFGAKLYGQVHFVNFDFMTRKRIWQTSSWEIAHVNNVVDDGHTIYSLMDNTFIVALDKTNGETKWTRFESGQSQPDLIPISDSLLYTSEGGLRITDGKKVENIRIPTIRPTSLESLVGDNLYLTTKDKHNVGCYNIKKREMVWEIAGSFPIIKTLTIKGQKDGRIVDVMLVRTKKDVAILNLTDGRAHTFFRADSFTDMHRTGNHVLFHQTKGTTMMIPGVDIQVPLQQGEGIAQSREGEHKAP